MPNGTSLHTEWLVGRGPSPISFPDPMTSGPRPDVSTLSSPPSVSMASVSKPIWAKLMPSLTGRPVTVTAPKTTFLPVTVTLSSPSVPWISTRSGSPAPPPGARLAFSSPTLLRPIRKVSAPAPAMASMTSMPSRSMTMPPTSRVKRSPWSSKRLGVAAAGEGQRVAARAAVDGVAAVAGRPAEAVEVGAHVGGVVTAASLDVVEVGAAEQRVVARAAEDHVVAVAAVERERHRVGRGADDVVAAVAVDTQAV